jgi:hypothetical protein
MGLATSYALRVIGKPLPVVYLATGINVRPARRA